jgi:hypothetical protein
VRVDTEAVYGGLESALTWLPDPSGDFAVAYEQHGEQKAFNYLAANFIRALERKLVCPVGGDRPGELRRLGFNTVANWSDWQIANQSGPLRAPRSHLDPNLPLVYRDFQMSSPRFHCRRPLNCCADRFRPGRPAA